MRLIRHTDPVSFLSDAGPFLAAREAEHNLLLGIAGRLVENPRLYGEEPAYFAAVTRGDEVVGAALRTPPHQLLLSEFADPAGLDEVATDVEATYEAIPGVNGPVDVSRRFAERWARMRGCAATKVMAQRIFAISEVAHPTGVPGRMRKAQAVDRELLVEWIQAFVDEAHAETGGRSAGDAVDDYLGQPGDYGAYLWEDGGRPVSMAGGGSPTPSGARIGPVYTPPDLRGRGYASVLTAALTQKLLDGGRRLCFLYADLANPTSNRIYQRIGYRPVTDVDVYRFEPAT